MQVYREDTDTVCNGNEIRRGDSDNSYWLKNSEKRFTLIKNMIQIDIVRCEKKNQASIDR